MVKLRRLVYVVVLLLCVQTNSLAKKSKYKCPIGFEIAFSHKEDPICYRLKGPESFADSFEDCTGNLYTSKLYFSYNITKFEATFWTEYRNLYPGGPFVDWSFTKSTAQKIPDTIEVKYYDSKGVDEDLCVAFVDGEFTAGSCDEVYYRYCFVRPYVVDDVPDAGCEKFKGAVRFYSPWPTCLFAVSAVGGGAVRATWRQAEELCDKRGGSLLNKGWVYLNNPYFETSASYAMYPLSIVFNDNQTVLKLVGENGSAVIDSPEWNFKDSNFSSDTTLGAVQDYNWQLVNSSYIFYDVFCEKAVELPPVSLKVSVDEDNKLVLSASQPVDKDNIYCFTESMYDLMSVKITYDDSSNLFILKPGEDGYYWCIHIDSKNYQNSESNKQLFVREKQSVTHTYAVKLRMEIKYKRDNLDKFKQSWDKKLSEYIFCMNRFGKELSNVQETTTEQTLEPCFKIVRKVNMNDQDIIRGAKVKRLFLDAKTALVHVAMNPDLKPVPPGKWMGLEVLSMKPVYYCPATFEDYVPETPIGSSVTTRSCVNYSCIGDFNEGLQWVTRSVDGCNPVSVTATIRMSEVTMAMPTVVTRAPETAMSDGLASGDHRAVEAYSDEFKTQKLCCFCHGSNSESKTRDKSGYNLDSSEESTEEAKPEKVTYTEFPTDSITTTDPTTSPSNPTTDPTTIPTEFTLSTTNAMQLESVVSSKGPGPSRPTTTTEAPFIPTPSTAAPPLTRPPPEEQLQQVMENLDALINNNTNHVSVETISDAFDQVDELLAESEDLEIPGELLHLLDNIGARMTLNDSEPVAAVRENIALLVADAEPELPVTGLRIAARESDVFTDDAFEIMRDEVNSTHLQSEASEVVVQLPSSVSLSQRRISFVVFRTDRAFQNSIGRYRVNSRVLSINVENLTQFDQGEVIDIHLSPMRGDLERNQSRACAYWHFLEDGTGYWSQEGCTFIASTQEGMLDTCRCDHLTHFAEILIPRTSFSSGHETALEIISIVGCVMSIVGLLLVGLTAILFRSWRRDFSNKIWLQLCISIFALVICFLIVVFANFDEYSISCMLVGVLLHYSTLSSFCWMLVAAVLSYRRLVMVFTRDASHKLLKASAFSWGAPCAVVGILLSVAPHSYAGQFEGEVPSGAFCYPSGLGLWLAVYAPIALMVVANWTLFILIVRSVFASKRIQRHGDTNEALRCASVSCLLVFLFGLPWIFALFLSTNLVTVYLFTLTATFQGFVLFVFFVLGNKKTRDLWLNKLKIRQTRKVPVTSSTYTNRSTGNPGWRGGSAGPATMEAKNSKPRSLTTTDDSRFS